MNRRPGASTRMHVWNRPPLPNESPEPTNRTLTLIVLFPFLLATVRREVQQRPDVAEGLDTTSFGEVRAIDIVPVTQKNAETECFTFRSDLTEVDVEVVIGRRIPRKRPAHSLAVRLDIRQRRSRNERK